MLSNQTLNGEINLTELNELSRRIEKLLLTWSIASLIVGIVLMVGSPGTILAGIGLQAIIWAVIDLVIIAFVLKKQVEKSVKEIARTVYINLYLDIIYQIVGLIVIVIFLQDLYMMGNGIGVIIQGFFLLLLDSYYYRSLKKL